MTAGLHALLGPAVGFALSAPLLWLGAELAASRRLKHLPGNVRRFTDLVAAGLVAAGLWWPAHWIASSHPRPVEGGAWLLALAGAAVLGLLTQRIRRRPSRRRDGSRRSPRGSGTLRAFGAPAAALLATALAGAELGPAGPDWSALVPVVLLIGLAAAVLQWPATRSAGRPGAPERSKAPATDPLTGLHTREHFERRLASAMEKCADGKRRLALLFVDLDGFKPVNDTYGHGTGDKVLEQVGERLRAVSRGHDIVARVGGDEFLVLLPQAGSEDAVVTIARRLIDALGEPFHVDQREIAIGCSIGIAFHSGKGDSQKAAGAPSAAPVPPRGTERPPSGGRAAALIARADAAMYAAKRAGGATHCLYTPEMEVDAADTLALVADLRRAIAAEEFELVYQPKMDARSGKVTAAEALLRWRHPARGVLSPTTFIPVAERSGLIGALGDWVIEDACRQARAWRESGLRMRVAINLSPQQMRRDDIVTQIAGALERHRIHPSLLTCEITESLAMEDTRATQETFRRLGELGVHLSIDDFGTGYSSLSYLRTLPAEELKIDRSFVTDLEHSDGARAIVDAIVKMAHALGRKVVAEGVETPRQREILGQLGCDELQGYLFARPMSARALLLWALRDRDEQATDFQTSLFGETRQVQKVGA